MNVLNEWLNEHKEEFLNERNDNKAGSGKKCNKLNEGDNLIELNMTEITENTFDFDGTKVKRYFYVYKEYNESDPSTFPLLVPKSVHFDIVEMVSEYGDKLNAVKVKKSGHGKGTEYKVFPVLK